MPKLSSFGQGKNIRPKKSRTSFLHAALHLFLVSKTLVCKYSDNLGENIFTLLEGCFRPLLQWNEHEHLRNFRSNHTSKRLLMIHWTSFQNLLFVTSQSYYFENNCLTTAVSRYCFSAVAFRFKLAVAFDHIRLGQRWGIRPAAVNSRHKSTAVPRFCHVPMGQ